MDRGLYFYKLQSPYEEDVTKNNKLTINEIDHNFFTLKTSDVKDMEFDETDGTLKLHMFNGDIVYTNIDLTHYTKDFDVRWDEENTAIVFKYDDKEVVINEFITSILDDSIKNKVEDIFSNASIDNSIITVDGNKKTLSLNPIEFSGKFKAVNSLINKISGEDLPKDYIKKGERYLTFEKSNNYGYLYDFNSVIKINETLTDGWRIPTKEDWDDMLNSIEEYEEDKNHTDGSTEEKILGKFAGKLLKSENYWKPCIINDGNDENEPQINPNSVKGVDKYLFNSLPTIFTDTKEYSEYWTTTKTDSETVYVKCLSCDNNGIIQRCIEQNLMCSIRLMKEYDGNNFFGVEIINGIKYNTVLMPSSKSEHNFNIWLCSNISFENENYTYENVNVNSDLVETVYFINEWDGNKWLKKQLIDGDSLVIKNGLNGVKDNEYQLINGKLVSLKQELTTEFNDSINNLNLDNVGEQGEFIATVEQKSGLISATSKKLVSDNDSLIEYTKNGIKSNINLISERNENSTVYKIKGNNDNIIGDEIVVDDNTTNTTTISNDIHVIGSILESELDEIIDIDENGTKKIKSGTTLQNVLESLLYKEKYPENASFNEGVVQVNFENTLKISIKENGNLLNNNSYVEVGTLVEIEPISISKNPSVTYEMPSYSGFDYGYSVDNDNNKNEDSNPNPTFSTVDSKTDFNLTIEYDGFNNELDKENIDSIIYQRTKSIRKNSVTISEGENKIHATVSSPSYTYQFNSSDELKYYPCSNVGNTKEEIFVSGYTHEVTTEPISHTNDFNVNGARYSFIGLLDNNQTNDYINNLSGEKIRELNKLSYCSENIINVIGEGDKYKSVVIAFPKNWGNLILVKDNIAFGSEIQNEFILLSDSLLVNGNNNYEPIEYKVCMYKTETRTFGKINYTIKIEN